MIDIIDLHKSFGKTEVHKGINLRIIQGAITVIIGPSGTGKSILLKQMMGLIPATSGKIIVDGVDITKISKSELEIISKKFGMVFQNAALFDSMNVYDNVSFALCEHTKLNSDEISVIVDEKLKMVGLSGSNLKFPSELSGGMKKRVGLARSLALEPNIILYDEPTTGLDPIMTDVVDELIYDTQKKLNITSVVVSHDIQSVFKIADYVAMLYDGKVVFYGTVDEFRATDNAYVQQFIAGSKNGPINVN